MKVCTNCNLYFPDNFKKCSYCNGFLPEQPVPGSEQVELFMYDDDVGRRIHTGDSFKGIVIFMVILMIASPFLGIISGLGINATLIVGFAIMVVFIVITFAHAYKKSVPRTSYIYYRAVLYKIMLWGGDIALRNKYYGRDLVGKIFALRRECKEIEEFEMKCKKPESYLNLFFRYLSGEQVWNSVSGGEGKIDALKDFRITGETKRLYYYSYIDEKGRQKSGKLLKCYPDIESVFKR